MGTRADFFIGIGPTAKWIGSTSYDGHPDSWGEAPLAATSEAEFRAAVEKMLSQPRDEGLFTRPEEGWPWPWEDHRITDYAYSWDPARGPVVSCGGRLWVTAQELRNNPECELTGRDLRDDEVLDMRSYEKADVLAKSGLMLLATKE